MIADTPVPGGLTFSQFFASLKVTNLLVEVKVTLPGLVTPFDHGGRDGERVLASRDERPVRDRGQCGDAGADRQLRAGGLAGDAADDDGGRRERVRDDAPAHVQVEHQRHGLAGGDLGQQAAAAEALADQRVPCGDARDGDPVRERGVDRLWRGREPAGVLHGQRELAAAAGDQWLGDRERGQLQVGGGDDGEGEAALRPPASVMVIGNGPANSLLAMTIDTSMLVPVQVMVLPPVGGTQLAEPPKVPLASPEVRVMAPGSVTPLTVPTVMVREFVVPATSGAFVFRVSEAMGEAADIGIGCALTVPTWIVTEPVDNGGLRAEGDRDDEAGVTGDLGQLAGAGLGIARAHTGPAPAEGTSGAGPPRRA